MSAEAKKTDSIGRALYTGRCKSSDTTTKEAGNHSNQELTRTSYKYDLGKSKLSDKIMLTQTKYTPLALLWLLALNPAVGA